MRRLVILTAYTLLGTLSFAAKPGEFDGVKIHRHKNAANRALVDKVGTLTFDDTGRKLILKTKEASDKFEIGYDTVTKIVFEVTTHMRGGTASKLISAVPDGGAFAGMLIAGQHVHDYWFYLEYNAGDQSQQVLLEVPKNSSENVITKAKALFGPHVTVSDFHEQGEHVDVEKLTDWKSKQVVRVDKENHPLPEIKSDKATVVVVCPPLAARYSGRGNQYKLHANDHVIAVNKGGTYSFAYLDPGKYHLVSQSENANGFEIELEAGKSYYFLQNIVQGVFKGETLLSHNSPELVMYELDGSNFSDWKPKEPKVPKTPKGSVAFAAQP
jgi:hypothetical protein